MYPAFSQAKAKETLNIICKTNKNTVFIKITVSYFQGKK